MIDLQATAWEFGGWLLRKNVEVIAIIALVYVFHIALRRRLSAGWRSTLWLVVFVHMLLPVRPSSNLSLFNVTPESNVVQLFDVRLSHRLQPAGLDEFASHSTPTSTSSPEEKRQQGILRAAPRHRVANTLLVVWSAVAAFLVLRLLVQTWRIQRRSLAQPDVANEQVLALMAECKRELGIQRIVRLRFVDAPPAVLGWLRPVLLIPEDFVERFCGIEQRFILLHELRHVATGDCAVRWCLKLLACVHWFNPLLVWARRRWQTERELACDAWVLRDSSSRDRRKYGATLLSIADSSAGQATFGMGVSQNSIEQRIRALVLPRKNRELRFQASLGVLSFVAFVGLTGATQPMVRDQPSNAVQSDRVNNNGNEQDVLIVATSNALIWNCREILAWPEILERLKELRAHGPIRLEIQRTRNRALEFGENDLLETASVVSDELLSGRRVRFSNVPHYLDDRFERIMSAADLAIAPSNSVQGQVLAPDGSPVSDALVTAYPRKPEGDRFWRLRVNLHQVPVVEAALQCSTITDDHGNFTVNIVDDAFLLVAHCDEGFLFDEFVRGSKLRVRLDRWSELEFVNPAPGHRLGVSALLTFNGANPARFTTTKADVAQTVRMKVPAGKVNVRVHDLTAWADTSKGMLDLGRQVPPDLLSTLPFYNANMTVAPGEKTAVELERITAEDRVTTWRRSRQQGRTGGRSSRHSVDPSEVEGTE